MNLIKKLVASVGLLGLSVVSVVLALDSVTITPNTLDVNPGDVIEYTTTVAMASGGVVYDWFIDGVFISTHTGSTLTLPWAEYVSLFPADATANSSREVSLIATDTLSAATGSSVLTVTQLMVPVTGGSSGISGLTGGDNYCGDGELKTHLGEECDDGNGKNGDGCTINCECEKGYDCLEDGTIVLAPVFVTPDDQSNDENGDNDGDGNGDMEDDTPGIKDMLADRNRTPLNLGDDTPANAKMPLNAPETGASLEQLRMMGIYVTSDKEETIDISSVLPKRAAGYVAHPVVLPLTGTADTHRPARTIIL